MKLVSVLIPIAFSLSITGCLNKHQADYQNPSNLTTDPTPRPADLAEEKAEDSSKKPSKTRNWSLYVGEGTHACAIHNERGGTCWGGGEYGEIGNGMNGEGNYRSHPETRLELSSIEAIATTQNATCALNTEGQVFCWGRNHEGQLGFTSRRRETSRPQKAVEGLPKAFSISGGNHTFCAIAGETRDVYCWGENHEGLNKINAVPNIVALRLGQNCATAVDDRGKFFYWGKKSKYAPVALEMGVSQSGCTTSGSCIIKSADNHVYCNGSLALTEESKLVRFKKVEGIPKSTQIGVRGDHACALSTEGEVYCWGYDYYLNNRRPKKIEIENVAELHVGSSHICGILTNNQIRCWGSNSSGQYGNGTLEGPAESNEYYTVSSPFSLFH
jgi:alpha-tubulin suppressor-like RCC1 family protein